MVSSDVINTVQNCMHSLDANGIPVAFCVLYGSQAQGNPHRFSDIDLIVVSPVLEQQTLNNALLDKLWLIAGRVDYRIEPVPCGVHDWEHNTSNYLIELGRQKGIKILPEPVVQVA